jgi:hypothetical protein
MHDRSKQHFAAAKRNAIPDAIVWRMALPKSKEGEMI